MVVIIQPMFHLPGHFKTYTSRLISGFLDVRSQSVLLISTDSKDSNLNFISNSNDLLRVKLLASRHPFLSTIDAAIKLLGCKESGNNVALFFLDYHFIAMALLYPLLRCRFKNIVLTHPGSTFPIGELSYPDRIKAILTQWCARIIGKIATRQVYHSNLVKQEFFRPLFKGSKSAIIEWGVTRSKFNYSREKNISHLTSKNLNIVAFGKIEKRKGISAFLKWIEGANVRQSLKINIALLGKVDAVYKAELRRVIDSCKNIKVDLKDYSYTDQELQLEILQSNYALLAYDRTFTAASGVLADVIGFGVPILTCKECVFSEFVTSNNIGYSIDYNLHGDSLLDEIVNYYVEQPWDLNIKNLSSNSWKHVAERHLDMIFPQN